MSLLVLESSKWSFVFALGARRFHIASGIDVYLTFCPGKAIYMHIAKSQSKVCVHIGPLEKGICEDGELLIDYSFVSRLCLFCDRVCSFVRKFLVVSFHIA